MAIAFGIAWVGAQGNSVTSVTAAAITSTGNFIGAAVTNNNTIAAVNPVVDSKSNTYQKALGPITSSTDNVYLYYAESPTVGASHTITATSSTGSSFMTLCAATWSGLAASGTLDKTATGNGTSVNLLSSNTANTTSANELLLGCGTISAGTFSAWTAGASYTIRSNIADANSGGTGFIEDRIVSATGAYSSGATWTGSSGNWVDLIATFSDGGGGADVLQSQACF